MNTTPEPRFSGSARQEPDPHEYEPHELGGQELGDPLDWIQVIERAFLDRLMDRLVELLGSMESLGDTATDGWPRPVPELVGERLTVLEDQVRPLTHNSMDVANVHFASLAVAAYDVLEPVCGGTTAVSIVDECLDKSLRDQILTGTRAMLDAADDPFSTLVATSKERESSFFGPSFRFERPVDDEYSYVLDVPGCLFHEALTVLGRPELQPVLCRFDLNWVDAIDPRRHHLGFARPVTFATGATCRMVFTRIEHHPGA